MGGVGVEIIRIKAVLSSNWTGLGLNGTELGNNNNYKHNHNFDGF